MKVLHVEMNGGLGGIQTLTRDIAMYSSDLNDFYFLKGGGIISDELNKKNCQVIIDDTPFKKYNSKANKLSAFILKNKYDAVIFHDDGIISCLTIKKIKESNVVLLLYEHSDLFEIYSKSGIKNFIYKQICLESMKHAHSLIAISKFVKEQCNRLYPNDKTVVIYNGICLDNFHPRLGSKSDKFEVLYVGRLTAVKGVALLIDAMKPFKTHNDMHLTIVGDGDQREELVNMTKEYGLNEIITFVGAQQNVSQYYSSADLFVHPATWNEGFGITLVEALASGVPCVAFHKGALPEIIEDNVNGLLVKEISSDALSKAIFSFYHMKDTEQYIAMKKNAIESSKKFSIQNTISGLKNLIETLEKDNK